MKTEILLYLSSLLLNLQVGMGTIFWAKGDRFNPDPNMACYSRPLRDDLLVVAHKTLPCRSKVLLINPRNKLHTIATVADRGPKRALIDLSRATAKALKHNGLEPIIVIPLDKKAYIK
jgi:hypothetical protein